MAPALLTDLEPVVASLYDRHLAQSKEWFPHELVPWSRGRDYEPSEVWDEAASDLPRDVRSSLFVNLLTEDNLPYYSRTISAVFGRESAWGAWVQKKTPITFLSLKWDNGDEIGNKQNDLIAELAKGLREMGEEVYKGKGESSREDA